MTVVSFDVVGDVRRTLGSAIFRRIAGPDGAEVRQRLRQADDRWFPLDSPIARVHSDASMFVGGLSALLLQSLHPLAMAGVDQHSGFRGDPWGRLARTSHFLAVTTFGSAADAEAEIAQVRAVHRRVRGRAPDGRAYAASDPHLLSWVHVVEVEMFLRAHQRHGVRPLNTGEANEFVAQSAVVAKALGAVDVPVTTTELRAALEAYRSELRSTPEARSTARYLIASPPLPWSLRGLYLPLAGAAVALLPRWARWPLRLPWLPVAEATVLRFGGEAVTRTIRWALPAGVPRDDA